MQETTGEGLVREFEEFIRITRRVVREHFNYVVIDKVAKSLEMDPKFVPRDLANILMQPGGSGSTPENLVEAVIRIGQNSPVLTDSNAREMARSLKDELENERKELKRTINRLSFANAVLRPLHEKFLHEVQIYLATEDLRQAQLRIEQLNKFVITSPKEFFAWADEVFLHFKKVCVFSKPVSGWPLKAYGVISKKAEPVYENAWHHFTKEMADIRFGPLESSVFQKFSPRTHDKMTALVSERLSYSPQNSRSGGHTNYAQSGSPSASELVEFTLEAPNLSVSRMTKVWDTSIVSFESEFERWIKDWADLVELGTEGFNGTLKAKSPHSQQEMTLTNAPLVLALKCGIKLMRDVRPS